MKIFFKLLFSIFLSLLFCGESLALSLKGYKQDAFRSPEYANVYAYFEDYSTRLYESFEPRKAMWWKGFGVDVVYTLHRDGTVSDVKAQYNSDKIPKGYQYAMKLVKNLKPVPFPKDLEDESVSIEAAFNHTTYDVINVDPYGVNEDIHISICKNSRFKKRSAPKLQPMFPHLLKNK